MNPHVTVKSRVNGLADETSPYLLQHAHNPVDWYPWGIEALEKARQENKPVFLSIGYSACHWCHVMAHESFENTATADILNKNFISIKVDREERPDIDNIYMDYVAQLTGSGGWPLSVFITPDLNPFFGGTYFPPAPGYGRPGFNELLLHISEMWNTKESEIREHAETFTKRMNIFASSASDNAGIVNDSLIKNAYSELQKAFDRTNGGFAAEPKFPAPSQLSFLLRYYRDNKDSEALEMAEFTLTQMYSGGIYDHLGGGFHRYSVDREWLVPHFEKMLYDNAQLASVYLEAYQLTGKNLYSTVASEIFSYILNRMTDTKGGFYSAEDADSEGKEGIYYIWTFEELTQILPPESSELFLSLYNVKKNGNFSSHEPYHTGQNILHLTTDLPEAAEKRNIKEKDLKILVSGLKQTLLLKRGKRVPPGKDTKIIAAWNGLVISSLAKGFRVLQDETLKNAAVCAGEFIYTSMYRNRMLSRTYRTDTDKQIHGMLDDYAHTASAFLDLYEAGLGSKWLTRADELTGEMIKRFYDIKNGSFFYTADDKTNLIIRRKIFHDSALPAGNAAASYLLLRLARLLGKETYREMGETILKQGAGIMQRTPQAAGNLLRSAEFYLSDPLEIVIAGTAGKPDTEDMFFTIYSELIPDRVIAFAESDREPDSPLLQGKTSINGKPAVYFCRNFACKEPLVETGRIKEYLEMGK